MNTMDDAFDSRMINNCFKLAKKGLGFVNPNPLVGSVIVKNGKIISKGYHKYFGGSHAEIEAIKNSKSSLMDSTLYCNLEPCVHTNKKTPPCAPEIIKSGISRVVISNIDPNPEVSGKGIQALKDAGIKVDLGIEKEKGNELNKFFFNSIVKKLPYITLKIAQTSDGKINRINGKRSLITGEISDRHIHKLRSEYDAILVGVNTVKVDDPQLNIRNVKGKNPLRIIIDAQLTIPINSRVLNTLDNEKTWILCGAKVNNKKKELLKNKGTKILEFKLNRKKQVGLPEIIQRLYELKISSILVEGGQNIFSQFIENDLFDEILLFQSPDFFGSGLNSVNLSSSKKLKFKSIKKLGKDICITLVKLLE
jgi:diaminohydroxyphosphoribosylaminopyrimidine deaminase/5-amino-6-(5-phosphoribosylamino)uracil reductase